MPTSNVDPLPDRNFIDSASRQAEIVGVQKRVVFGYWSDFLQMSSTDTKMSGYATCQELTQIRVFLPAKPDLGRN